MTRKSKKSAVNYKDTFLLIIIGVGVGWLVGLSISSVLHIILGSIIALVAGAVGALVGLEQGARDKSESSPDNEESSPDRAFTLRSSRESATTINPLPLTMLVIGLGIGSVAGIYARTNDIFGPDPQKFARKWAGTGLDEKKIQQRLFDQLYPPKEVAEDSETKVTSSSHSEVSPSTGIQNPSANIQNSNSSAPPDIAGERKVNTSKTKPPTHNQEKEDNPVTRRLTSGLWEVTVEDCQMLRLKHGDELRTRLKALGDKRIIELVANCKGDHCLEDIKESVCRNPK
jgi:hypothetical protein